MLYTHPHIRTPAKHPTSYWTVSEVSSSCYTNSVWCKHRTQLLQDPSHKCRQFTNLWCNQEVTT